MDGQTDKRVSDEEAGVLTKADILALLPATSSCLVSSSNTVTFLQPLLRDSQGENLFPYPASLLLFSLCLKKKKSSRASFLLFPSPPPYFSLSHSFLLSFSSDAPSPYLSLSAWSTESPLAPAESRSLKTRRHVSLLLPHSLSISQLIPTPPFFFSSFLLFFFTSHSLFVFTFSPLLQLLQPLPLFFMSHRGCKNEGKLKSLLKSCNSKTDKERQNETKAKTVQPVERKGRQEEQQS